MVFVAGGKFSMGSKAPDGSEARLRDPKGLQDFPGARRVYRGGHFPATKYDLRASRRFAADPDFRAPCLGLRCIKPLK